MSIDKQTVEHLANLARIQVDSADVHEFVQDLNGIMTYVSEINQVVETENTAVNAQYNRVREDTVTVRPGQHTAASLKNAPSRQGDYIEVHQVL